MGLKVQILSDVLSKEPLNIYERIREMLPTLPHTTLYYVVVKTLLDCAWAIMEFDAI